MFPKSLAMKKLNINSILTLIVLFVTTILGFKNYLLFHSIAELYTIITFICITVLATNVYALSAKDVDHFYLFLGIASFFIGLIHILHALAYKGMGVFPNSTANLPTQLYIISRYMLSLSLLAAAFFAPRKINGYLVALIYSIATVLLLLSVFYWKVFPDCYLEGYGLTAFKIASEYIICIIFILAGIYLYVNRKNFHPLVLDHTYRAIAFAILGELVFTLYIGVYDIFNMLGHLLHIVSAVYIFRSLVRVCFTDPLNAIFSELSEKNEKLERKAMELQKINQQLEEEIKAKNRIQQELTVSRNLYQGLFHNLMDGFAYNKIIYDEEGSPIDYIFLEVNDAFAKFFGLKRSEMPGRRASELLPEACKVWLPLFSQVAKEGTTIRLKHHFVEENKWITISAYCPEKDYFATILTDVTDLKRSWEK